MQEEAHLVDQARIDTTIPAMCTCITSYDLCNIYNVDEMRVFYNMVRDQIVTQQQIIDYKKETI